ncbi:hypothetical protein PUNSTDRAFT_59423 [Punctularia strigosozonata HHB-11173 SS5]|uniref:uncharacterized protein n=1 Tax=Punctularia strigosozonata (strain HHB-11173) TaxID=741275 RepID=UPI0004417ACA|nr:uncharacterized protein PUNSTDRAFT_59423 [Punctularia strigosozonata HHB-11173 SS5]EIN14135.1 hypothetical protein PUNSTDRAFT_59423 [Punctularia strigosozonata HHB-11173 SS5]
MPSAGQFIALSTSSVGVGPGGTTSMVARVAVVGYRGEIMWEAYITPTMPVSDYRTATTGITADNLAPGRTIYFSDVQRHVAMLIEGKILIGHSLWNDLSVLGIPHPAIYTRDLALYQPFRNTLRQPNATIGLQTLVWQFMGRHIGEGAHDPIERARAAIDLYRSASTDWETSIAQGQWPCALPPSSFSRCYG